MNAIDKAIKDVQFNIPKEVLHYAFVGSHYGSLRYPVSLESVIREKVIDARVIEDCNIVGGVQDYIELSNLKPIFNDGTTLVYKIPKHLTQNKSITAVHSVNFDHVENNGYLSGMGGSSTLSSAAHKMADAALTSTPNNSAEVSIIGDNTISIKDLGGDGFVGSVKVTLSNDANMSNLNVTTYKAFSKLVLLAVKAWIHTNTIIPMDSGVLHGGAELGKFKDVVESYADSNELYDEYLETKWTKIAFMDDRPAYNRALKLTSF
jgi:hypothetical protein